MNDIKIFTEGKAAECSPKEQQRMFGVLCVILAEAVDADNKDLAWKLMREASQVGHVLGSHHFNVLYSAAAMEITRTFANREERSKSIFDKIKEVFAWSN